jgi:hypothetical protein
LELCQRFRAQIGRHRLKDAWSDFKQKDPGVMGVDPAELPNEGLPSNFRERIL